MKNKKIKIICFVLIGIAILVSGYFIISLVTKNNEKVSQTDTKKEPPQKENIEKIKIIDLDSNSRPYAVMINNINTARPYQSGLQDAYLVYEIIVEGGITRLMAVFKDQNTSRIGSIRSSRHYYLDYALENDAIYVHIGWSPQAQSDISTLKINNINGLYDSMYWREDLPVAYEHTAYASIEKIKAEAENKGYRMTSIKEPLLNYTAEEVDLSKNEDSLVASNVSIKYSNSTTTSYKYNETDKLYYRSVNGVMHTDYITKKQYTAKNIIIAHMSNDDMNDDKGRQNLNNIGTGEGYYITNGYATPITWSKSTRTSQTVYKLKNGDEINVNDGNTFIQIAPLNSSQIS